MLFKWAALYKHTLRMQINAGDYGGLGAVESACRIEHRPFTHCTPSPFTRAPIINNSCPCYVKPALESTSPQIPLILELLPAVQWTVLKSARVLRGPSPLPRHCFISLGSAVIIRFMATAYRWLPECSSDSCTSPSLGCPGLLWRPQHGSAAHQWWSSGNQTSCNRWNFS